MSKCLRISSTQKWTGNVGLVQTLEENKDLRFTATEMLRKFCQGKEDSSVESELRAPHMESETIKD